MGSQWILYIVSQSLARNQQWWCRLSFLPVATNSVAVHTHGDLSNRGIIAAAIFTEGHVEPIKITPPVRVEEHHYHHYPYTYPITPTPSPYEPYWIYNTTTNTGNYGRGSSSGILRSKRCSIMPSAAGGGTYTSNIANNSSGNLGSYDSMSFSADISDGEAEVYASLEELVSVGAGEHVDQKITYVTGLIKPIFTETVRVKYLWWDDLVAKLRTQTKAEAQPSGFPGDVKQKNIDLKGTPRIGKKGSFRRAEETYQPNFDRF